MAADPFGFRHDENTHNRPNNKPAGFVPSFKHHSPQHRRPIPVFRTIEFPGSPDYYPPVSEKQIVARHVGPYAIAPAAYAANPIIYPGTPDPPNVTRFIPRRTFQTYQVESEPVRQSAAIAPVSLPPAPAPRPQPLLGRRNPPSMADEIRARTAAVPAKPIISEEARVFGEIRRQFEDAISDDLFDEPEPAQPSTPQLREEISDHPKFQVPRSAPIHRRSLVNLSPVISEQPEPAAEEVPALADFPVLDYGEDRNLSDRSSSLSSAPVSRLRKHRDLAKPKPMVVAVPAPRGRRSSTSSVVTASSRGRGGGRGRGRPKEKERKQPQTRQAKLDNFRTAIRTEGGTLAVAVPVGERKVRKPQPKNRKEISMSVSEIPGIEISSRTQRRRVPMLVKDGSLVRYTYRKDGTLIGLAGMVDDAQPSLVVRNVAQTKRKRQEPPVKKTKAKSGENVIELAERRAFNFREDANGYIWATDKTTRKETHIFVPAGASELLDETITEGMTAKLRKGVASEVFTVIEFELQPGGLKEPEKIETPGSLRGVVLRCGEGDCLQVTVGRESKVIGVNGSFMVESETEWTLHNKHRTAECVVLLVLIADFLPASQ